MGVTMWVLLLRNRRACRRGRLRTQARNGRDGMAVTDEEGVATELGLDEARSSKPWGYGRKRIFRVVTFPGIQVRRLSTPATRRTPLRYRMAANRSHARERDRPFCSAEIWNLLMNEARSGTGTFPCASRRFLTAVPSMSRGRVQATERASCGIE